MNFSEFQSEAVRTSSKSPMEIIALGITGEAGEVADLVKKFVGHGHPFDLAKMESELGDVLWYIAAMCDNIGINLENVAIKNIQKLKKRYPEGFSTAASMARRDVIHEEGQKP